GGNPHCGGGAHLNDAIDFVPTDIGVDDAAPGGRGGTHRGHAQSDAEGIRGGSVFNSADAVFGDLRAVVIGDINTDTGNVFRASGREVVAGNNQPDVRS